MAPPEGPPADPQPAEPSASAAPAMPGAAYERAVTGTGRRSRRFTDHDCSGRANRSSSTPPPAAGGARFQTNRPAPAENLLPNPPPPPGIGRENSSQAVALAGARPRS